MVHMKNRSHLDQDSAGPDVKVPSVARCFFADWSLGSHVNKADPGTVSSALGWLL